MLANYALGDLVKIIGSTSYMSGPINQAQLTKHILYVCCPPEGLGLVSD